MNKILDNLNPEQIKAVKHFEGPMLVMAGAGSGKTKVLTNRIAYLIDEKQVSPYNVLAITFTNKAAKEMKSRVIDIVGEVGRKMHISTFHSMCVHILRQDIDLIGYRANFVIYDDQDTLSAIKLALQELNIDAKRYNPKRIKNIISNAKNDYIFPEEFRVKDDFTDIVKKVYKKYQNILMKSNGLDFDDLIMLTIKLFERSDEVLSFYQQKFQYILVDEYQDTNQSQFKLVRMLAQRHNNIFVVGDTDQSIYSWRGADIRNIIEFEKDFFNDKSKVEVVYLEQNYRSYQKILDCANCVIQNNYSHDKYVKKLWSERPGESQVTYYRAVNSDVEVEYIVQKIIDKCKHEGKKLNDFAILYRTNAMSLSLEKALNRKKIDYVIFGNVSFFERREIKDLVAYLRLIINKDDDISFLRVVNAPKRGIGNATIEQVKSYAIENNQSLFEASKEISSLSNRAKNSLMGFTDLVEHLREQLVDVDINDYIDAVLEQTNYLPSLINEATEEANARIENLSEFKTLTLDLEDSIGEDDSVEKPKTSYEKLSLILNNITLTSDKKHNKNNAVKLMTIHAAKGLEFPIVFIYGVEENIFPLGGDDISDDDLEEERRLMYVAITRAKDELYMTNSEMRKIYGSYRVNLPSRFIHEIDEDLLLFQGVKKAKNVQSKYSVVYEQKKRPEQKEAYEPTNNTKALKTGSKVIHSRFGEGVVVSLEGDYATIAFNAAHGIKKLDATHPAITVVK